MSRTIVSNSGLLNFQNRAAEIYGVNGKRVFQRFLIGKDIKRQNKKTVKGKLVVLGLTSLSDSISVFIEPSPRKKEKEEI